MWTKFIAALPKGSVFSVAERFIFVSKVYKENRVGAPTRFSRFQSSSAA